jgi:hypothetical protein
MAYIVEKVGPLSFTAAVDLRTETHSQCGKLDQDFDRNIEIGAVVLSDG